MVRFKSFKIYASLRGEGDAFDCPRCGRKTQKMQALHQYLPNFDLLHDIDGQKVQWCRFRCLPRSG